MTKIRVEVVSRKPPRPRKRTAEPSKRQTTLEGRRSIGDRIFSALHWLLRRSVAAWLCAAALAVTVTYGTPHVLVTYSCIDGGRCFECRYFGIQGMRDQLGSQWNCPVFVMMPLDWAPLIRKLKNG
ncbi:hypothetical protein [Histidinibacterium lentulum]|uniref:Uncharacterized protein n=1 Tax=Histidinibacterium lentulum TaxID=2480588 RepID=A0A3N2QEM0_9RHOB|nr:hypothetical protein [Histidinibacterium lentulum]ROT93629.1 hypothetical protein EAT49_20785 [Histidinibacterium lentulum]